MLRYRAEVLRNIRDFFFNLDVLEVETPVLMNAPGNDPNIKQWQTREGFYLHTSPEFGMKRLLAAGSADIYQICKVFRQEEQGIRHNAEFTLLEWYRLGWDEFQLMDEVAALVNSVAPYRSTVTHTTYRKLYLDRQLPCPHSSSDAQLASCVEEKLTTSAAGWRRSDCLDALMAFIVEPSLPKDDLVFVYDFPKEQAALAELKDTSHGQVARRFELYWKGLELANGYHELTDPNEQRRRLLNYSTSTEYEPEVDEAFLAALTAGLPVSSGVALGVDRLIMALSETQDIALTMAFPLDRA